jgi:phosphoglycolate phosphatase
LDRVLTELGMSDRFRVVVAGDDLPFRKPDPLPVRHIAERLSIRPAQLVMVGDGAQDVLSGRRAGARTVGVRGGIQPEERLVAARPDVIIDSLLELPAWIARWEASDP